MPNDDGTPPEAPFFPLTIRKVLRIGGSYAVTIPGAFVLQYTQPGRPFVNVSDDGHGTVTITGLIVTRRSNDGDRHPTVGD